MTGTGRASPGAGADTGSAHTSNGWAADTEGNPFAEHALEYKRKGWRPFPLPHGKKRPPPGGRTGWSGRDLTDAELTAEVGRRGRRNVGLRMTAELIGLDVDAYDGKPGAATLAALGPLPVTPRLTSREDPVSGIRFYLVPVGTVLVGAVPGGGCELIQRHHRFSVAAPSVHPEGRVYRWLDELGNECAIPAVADLPELPAAVIEKLRSRSDARGGRMAGSDEIDAWLAEHDDADENRPCRRLPAVLAEFDSEVEAGNSRHDAMLRCQGRLVSFATAGHRGGLDALEALSDRFLTAVDGERGRDPEEEWLRALRGAIGRVLGDPPGGRQGCCAPTVEGDFGMGESDDEQRQTLRDRLIWREDFGKLPKPEPLIADVLDTAQVTVLAGEYGTGKSFAVLGWAASVATGKPWLGHEVAMTGRVLYVASEESGVDQRIAAWEKHHGITLPPNRFAMLRDGIQLGDPAQVEELAEIVAEFEFVLVVVDTLAKSMDGMNENDTQDMNAATRAASRLLRATAGRGAVVIVHHVNKDGKIRGNTALPGNTESILLLSGELAAGVTMDARKRKDRPLGRSVVPSSGRSRAPARECLSGSKSHLMDHGTTPNSACCLTSSLTSPRWGSPGRSCSRSINDEGPPMAESTFHRALNALMRKKFVRSGSR